MSRGVNRVTLLGNVGKDPELRYTPNGTAVASFSLATTERYKGQDGEWKDQTEWHNLVCWRRQAEIAGEYVKKGRKLYVEGKIRTRSYDNKEGQKVYRTEIVIDTFILLDGGEGGGGARGAGSSGAMDSGYEPDQISDDDIPF